MVICVAENINIMLGDKKGFNRIVKAIHEKHYASEVLPEISCMKRN
jgi:predicted lactoylglutathione lyase